MNSMVSRLKRFKKKKHIKLISKLKNIPKFSWKYESKISEIVNRLKIDRKNATSTWNLGKKRSQSAEQVFLFQFWISLYFPISSSFPFLFPSFNWMPHFCYRIIGYGNLLRVRSDCTMFVFEFLSKIQCKTWIHYASIWKIVFFSKSTHPYNFFVFKCSWIWEESTKMVNWMMMWLGLIRIRRRIAEFRKESNQRTER